MITSRIVGIDKVFALFENLGPTLERETILGLAQLTYDGTQTGAGRHNKTGAMFSSVYNRAVPNGRAVGMDPQRAPHAAFVLFGARPHDIVPSKKKALRFPVNGRFRFARKVHHPGYRGDPFLIAAADQAVARMGPVVDAALRKADQ